VLLLAGVFPLLKLCRLDDSIRAGFSEGVPDPEARVATKANPTDRRSARIAIVERHIQFENDHNLEGVLDTFGDTAHYEDAAWRIEYPGRDGVHTYYEQLLVAMPDLQIEVQHRHVTDEAILVEVLIRGTQLGPWRGLPATGRRVEVPLCGIYTFDDNDRLSREKIYYDRATVLRQLGVFREPEGLLGRIAMLTAHPITIARALVRKLAS
jgi:steroid delta-isomerase-like uncharacterized protein